MLGATNGSRIVAFNSFDDFFILFTSLNSIFPKQPTREFRYFPVPDTIFPDSTDLWKKHRAAYNIALALSRYGNDLANGVASSEALKHFSEAPATNSSKIIQKALIINDEQDYQFVLALNALMKFAQARKLLEIPPGLNPVKKYLFNGIIAPQLTALQNNIQAAINNYKPKSLLPKPVVSTEPLEDLLASHASAIQKHVATIEELTNKLKAADGNTTLPEIQARLIQEQKQLAVLGAKLPRIEEVAEQKDLNDKAITKVSEELRVLEQLQIGLNANKQIPKYQAGLAAHLNLTGQQKSNWQEADRVKNGSIFSPRTLYATIKTAAFSMVGATTIVELASQNLQEQISSKRKELTASREILYKENIRFELAQSVATKEKSLEVLIEKVGQAHNSLTAERIKLLVTRLENYIKSHESFWGCLRAKIMRELPYVVKKVEFAKEMKNSLLEAQYKSIYTATENNSPEDFNSQFAANIATLQQRSANIRAEQAANQNKKRYFKRNKSKLNEIVEAMNDLVVASDENHKLENR